MNPPIDTQSLIQKAPDVIDALDAALATLDARMPFTKRMQEILKMIEMRLHKESVEELESLPTEV